MHDRLKNYKKQNLRLIFSCSIKWSRLQRNSICWWNKWHFCVERKRALQPVVGAEKHLCRNCTQGIVMLFMTKERKRGRRRLQRLGEGLKTNLNFWIRKRGKRPRKKKLKNNKTNTATIEYLCCDFSFIIDGISQKLLQSLHVHVLWSYFAF